MSKNILDTSKNILDLEAKVIGKTGIIRYYPMVISRGDGARLWDVDGREYIDFSSGGGVANIGYNHPLVIDAIAAQSKRLTHDCYTVCSNDRTPLLASELIKLLPGDYEKKIWFGLSGSDACEWVYKMLPKVTGRNKLVSFIGNYQGQTMGASALSGLMPQQSFLSVSNVIHIPYPYCYRCPLNHHPDTCNQECFSYFSEYLVGTLCDAGDIAAVVLEPIQGDAGIIIPPAEYLKKLKDFCKEHGIILVVDEVLSGVGRTGTWWASQQLDISPDLVVMGKALGSGVPISAVGGRADLLDAMTASHHVTCGGNVLACAASLATLDVIKSEKLLDNAYKMGERLRKGLKQISEKSKIVGEIRGLGLLTGVEIEQEGLPAQDLAHKVVFAAWQRGLLIYYLGLFGNTLIACPPLVINQTEIDAGTAILSDAILAVERGEIHDKDIEGFKAW